MSKIAAYKIALEGETKVEGNSRLLFLAAKVVHNEVWAWVETFEPVPGEDPAIFCIFRDGDEVSDDFCHQTTVFDGETAFHIYQKYE